MSRKESLVRGAAALALAGLIIKVSNLLVRVPLTRLMTAEGLGIYQMVLPAFFALYHIAAGGVPVAVQNLVAEYVAQGRRRVAEQVMSMALSYALTTGTVAGFLLVISAERLAAMLGEPRAAMALMAVAPAVPLFAVDSIYRNYMQGRKLMSPSATASVLEQGTKVAVSMAAAYYLIVYGKEFSAAGATLGITTGALISLLYMVYICRNVRADDGPTVDSAESRPLLIRRIIKLAWPVTIGSIVMPVFQLVDVGIVQRGFLKAGYLQAQATAMYGAYSGIAVQVTWFPVVLTGALASAMVPVLAGAKARADRDTVRERVLMGLRTTGLVCLPVAFGVAVLAYPIAALFGDANAAAPLLYMAPVAYLGPLAWFMAAQLQALGKTAPPMRNLVVAYVIKLGLDALLAPMRGVDVKGVAIASVVMFLVFCWLNARALEAELDEPLPWYWLLRGPLMASLAMGATLFGLAWFGLLPRAGWASVTLAVATAPLLYLAILMGSGALTKEEIKGLAGPVGAKLERWLHLIWPFG